jgi:hypothetical protein
MSTAANGRRDLGVAPGQKFGRLTVRAQDMIAKRRIWWCDCECGGTTRADGHALVTGRYLSCGCIRRKHGHAVGANPHCSPEYSSWSAMLARCENPKHPAFKHYGGRGITICKRWRASFESFASDMGPRPSVRHSLDRFPNGDGNYEPGNCRWATTTEQARNRSSNHHIVAHGRTMTMSEWSALHGVPSTTIRWRILNGWPPDRAVTEKSRERAAAALAKSQAPEQP